MKIRNFITGTLYGLKCAVIKLTRDFTPANPAASPNKKAPLAGYTIIEVLISLTLIAIVLSIAVPVILGAREKVVSSVCDMNYYALANEIANEFDTEVDNNRDGTATTSIAAEIEKRHSKERNPRRTEEKAYEFEVCESFISSIPDSCQVIVKYKWRGEPCKETSIIETVSFFQNACGTVNCEPRSYKIDVNTTW